MEALLSLLNETVLFQFLLLFARVVSFMAFMPVFGHAAVSPRIRVSLALFFTFFIYPLVDIQSNINQDNFILALFSEITLGLVASMFVNIIFSAVRVIGEFVEYSTALSMASMFDPTTGSQEGLGAKMLFWIAIVLFFQTGLYEMTLVILVKSFSVIHLGTFDIFSYNGIQVAIDEVKRMFTFAFAVALPLFFIGFIKTRIALKDKEAYKNNMYQTMSHELKTPIMVISSHVEAAEDNIIEKDTALG